MKTGWNKLLLAILLIMCVGCQIQPMATAIESTPSLTTPQPSETVTGSLKTNDDIVLLEDDFSDENSGWNSSGNEESKYYYANGEYYVMALKSNSFYYVTTGDNYQNSILNVELRHISGDDQSTGGLVIWRYKNNGTFLALTITDEQNYSIHRYIEGQYSLIKIHTYSEFLRPAGQVNKITIIILNDHNDIYFNDHFIYSFIDPKIRFGGIGIGVTPDSSSAVQVAFDNLSVYQYEPGNGYTPERPELTPTPSYSSITWDELVKFLADDHTNWNTFDLNTYNCLDFAVDLVKNAKQQNIKARIVAVNFVGQDVGHAFVEFETADRGTTFVEPQGDNTYSNVVIGNPLCDDWGKFECMGVISSIDHFGECNHSHECSVEMP